MDSGNVVGKTFGKSFFSVNFPAIFREKTGNGTAKTAEGNTATAEFDY